MAFSSRFLVIFFCAAALVVPSTGLGAEDVYHPEEFWGASIPATWELFEIQPQLTSFSDAEGRAIFQIFTFPAGLYADAEALAEPVIENLGASADLVEFVYVQPEYIGALYRGEEPVPPAVDLDLGLNPRNKPELGQVSALLADLTWNTGSLSIRGYGIFLPGGEEANSYAVLAYSLDELYETYHDFLLSTLDSFQPWMLGEDEYLRAPGPVSQFFVSPGELARTAGQIISTEGRTGMGRYAGLLAERAEATQVVIDREARILAQYQEAPAETQLEAWRRFYQQIYRDSFADLAAEAYFALQDSLAVGEDRANWAAPILKRLHQYEYRRTGTLSDLESPQTAIIDRAGDCDTLVLTYLALLDHLGIEGIVMVSPKHAHSLAGVGSGSVSPNPAARARFTFGGVSWLVAELTEDVDLGLIAASMADPADWQGFDLRFRPE